MHTLTTTTKTGITASIIKDGGKWGKRLPFLWRIPTTVRSPFIKRGAMAGRYRTDKVPEGNILQISER